jgi:hypothetical protein
MEGLTLFKEEEHRKKSLWISVTIHILLLLITLWPLLKKDPEKTIDTQYSVAIDFAKTPQEITKRSLEKLREQESASTKGTAAEGEQSPQNKEKENPREAPPVEKIEVRQPKTSESTTIKTSPSPPSRPIESTIFEDNDVIAEIPKSTKTKSSNTSASSGSSDEVVSVPKRSGRGTSGTSSTPGTGDVKPSNKPGSGTGQGKKGTGEGRDPSGTDSQSGKGTKGAGTGVFDGTGDGIFGRQPVDGKIPADLVRQNGKITMKVCIDKRGRNTFVSIIDKETTIKNKSLQDKAKDAMAKYLWEEDYSAAQEQCGKYTFIFKL